MLWLLLLIIAGAADIGGLGVSTQHEVNIYSNGSVIFLNFTAYSNIPIFEINNSMVKNISLYNLNFSKDAKIEVYEDNKKLCEATATIKQGDKFWGVCTLPLNPGIHHIYYNISHPNYGAPIVGYRRIIVKNLGDNLIISSSVSPLGVDIGKMFTDYLNRMPKDIVFWIILLITFMGSALYARGEQLAVGIFDLLYPRLPKPKADLGWSSGLTPGGPVIGAVKNMSKVKTLFVTKSQFIRNLLTQLMENNPWVKSFPIKTGVSEALLPITLAIISHIQKQKDEHRRIQDAKQYGHYLKVLDEELLKLSKDPKNSHILQNINHLLDILSGFKVESTGINYKKEINNLRNIINVYVASAYYADGYESLTQKFFPAEIIADYSRNISENLLSQWKNRKYFQKLVDELIKSNSPAAKRVKSVLKGAGWVLDKGVGGLAYTAGLTIRPASMVGFWFGKTTRQIGVTLHEMALPFKMLYHSHVDKGYARVKAEEAWKVRKQSVSASKLFTSGENVLKLSQEYAKKADTALKKDDITGYFSNKILENITYLQSRFFPVRIALGFPVAIWHSFKASYHDIRWWFYDNPISKELRPEISKQIINNSIRKVHEDAIRLIVIDKLERTLPESIKLLHNDIYTYFKNGILGSKSYEIRSKIKTIFNSLSDTDIKEINELISLLHIDDPLNRHNQIKEAFNSLEQSDNTNYKLAKLLISELDNAFEKEITNNSIKVKDIINNVSEGNVELFDIFLSLDKSIREKSELLGREWGIYEKDYQSLTSDDPHLTLRSNFKDDEALLLMAINWGTRLKDIKKGIGLALASDIQFMVPVTETWVNARLLGYETISDLLKDNDIDVEIKKTVLKELLHHMNRSDLIDNSKEEPQDELGVLLKDIFVQLLNKKDEEPLVFDDDKINAAFSAFWNAVPTDKNYQEMQEAIYSHTKQNIEEQLDPNYVRKRALEDLHHMKEAFIESIKHVSDVFDSFNIFELFSDENKLYKAFEEDNNLAKVFDIYDDPVLQEGYASSTLSMNVVSYREIANAKKNILDTYGVKHWFKDQLKGKNVDLVRALLPLISTIKRSGTNLYERSYLLQSYLQYKKGVHSQNMLVTLEMLKKQSLEVQVITSSPHTNYADQVPNQIAHMVGSLMVSQSILKSKGIDVLLEDISVKDMEKLVYGKGVYRAEINDGKLSVKEVKSHNLAQQIKKENLIVGHAGELYNIKPYDNFMIVTRNDEAILKPLLYGEDGPRFIKEIKRISRRRFSALIDESYLADVTINRESSSDTVINVAMYRWDSTLKQYVPDYEPYILPDVVYGRIIKDLDRIETQLSKHGSVEDIFDMFYIYGNPDAIESLLSIQPKLDFLPKHIRRLAKQVYKNFNKAKSDPQFNELTSYLEMLKDKSLGAKLLKERIEWLLSNKKFHEYYKHKKQHLLRLVEAKKELDRLRTIYSTSSDKSYIYKRMVSLKSQLGKYADTDVLNKMYKGYYLSIWDSIEHNELRSFLAYNIREITHRPDLMKHIKYSYIIDEAEKAKERIQNNLKGWSKIKASIKDRIYRDIYFQHGIVQYLFLPYAMSYEKADHASSIAQINYPGAINFYGVSTNKLIEFYEGGWKSYITPLADSEERLDKEILRIKRELKNADIKNRPILEKRLEQLQNLEKSVLESLATIYQVDKSATLGYTSSAWIATTRSPEKIWSSVEGFGKGAQIASDFHAGSGLYYPTYIWFSHHASDVYQGSSGVGIKNSKEYMPRGFLWNSLPIHELSLSDYIGNDKLTYYRIKIDKLKNRHSWLESTWRSFVQPFLIASMAEKAILNYGVSGHAKLADVRQLYQAYRKSLFYTSSLDIPYLASEEEIEAILSQLPAHMRQNAQDIIRMMFINKGYYSAKNSNISEGSGFGLVLSHLGSLSPFNPRALRDNQVYLSFALTTLGLPFALPLGVLIDYFEYNKYLPLAYRQSAHGESFIASNRSESPLSFKKITEGMGVADWEERLGYYLLPAAKHTWFSPTIAKRGDLPGYGDYDIATGRVRMHSWLSRMYLGRKDIIYDTNRVYISWVARWRSYREELSYYSPKYNIIQGLVNPFALFSYIDNVYQTKKHIRMKDNQTTLIDSAYNLTKNALFFSTLPLSASLAVSNRIGELSRVANRTHPGNMDRCAVCGAPKRRGYRCSRCGSP